MILPAVHQQGPYPTLSLLLLTSGIKLHELDGAKPGRHGGAAGLSQKDQRPAQN